MLLGALAAWVFQHRRLAFQSMFAAKSLHPPLRERRRPHHHYPTTPPPTPAASAQSAGNGPTALITAVSKPDSVIFINPSRDLHAKVPELTFSPNAVPPSWRRWRPCLRHTTYQPTIVAFEESADSGPTAQGATVSKTDSVVGENVFAEIQERETLHLNPRTVPSLLIIKRGPHWSLFLLKSLKPLCCQKMNMN